MVQPQFAFSPWLPVGSGSLGTRPGAGGGPERRAWASKSHVKQMDAREPGGPACHQGWPSPTPGSAPSLEGNPVLRAVPPSRGSRCDTLPTPAPCEAHGPVRRSQALESGRHGVRCQLCHQLCDLSQLHSLDAKWASGEE